MTHVDETYSGGAEAQSGGPVTEAIAAIVVIVLTILGLAQVVPNLLLAIATIAAGVALLVRGSGTASAVAKSNGSGAGGSFAVELLVGAAGVVLGILALLQVDPTSLVAIAVIAFGAALVLADHSNASLSSAAGLQAIAGLQAVVLGILALAGISSVVLVTIALLALGSFLFVNGSAFSGAVLAMFRR